MDPEQEYDSDPELMYNPKKPHKTEKTAGDSAVKSESCSPAQSKRMPRSQPTRRLEVNGGERTATDSCVNPTCGVPTELKCQNQSGGSVAISGVGKLYIFGNNATITRAQSKAAVKEKEYVLARNVVAIPTEGGGEINTLCRQTDQQKQDGMAYFIKGDTDGLNVTTEALQVTGSNWRSVTSTHWRPRKYSDVFNSPHDPPPPSPNSFILQYWSTDYETESPKDPNALFFYIETHGSDSYFKLGGLSKAKLRGIFTWDHHDN